MYFTQYTALYMYVVASNNSTASYECRLYTTSSCKEANTQNTESKGAFCHHYLPGLQGTHEAKYKSKEKSHYLLWRQCPLLKFTDVEHVFPSQD